MVSERFTGAMGLFSAMVAFLVFRVFLAAEHAAFQLQQEVESAFLAAQWLSHVSDCFQGEGQFTLQK